MAVVYKVDSVVNMFDETWLIQRAGLITSVGNHLALLDIEISSIARHLWASQSKQSHLTPYQ